MLNWDDPTLVEYTHDSPLRRKYRRLQSWYRQSVLGVPPDGTPRVTRLAISCRPTLSLLIARSTFSSSPRWPGSRKIA